MKLTSQTGSHGEGEYERFDREVDVLVLTQVDENWNLGTDECFNV